MGAARAALIEELAREIVAGGFRRVAVDGFDGAGKTRLADELAGAIGPAASRVRFDDFLNPQAVRYARGRDSPDGVFLDSFDWSIWLDVPFEVSIPRGAARGPGFGDADPAARTVVIDNTELDAPRRVLGP